MPKAIKYSIGAQDQLVIKPILLRISARAVTISPTIWNQIRIGSVFNSGICFVMNDMVH